MTLKIHTCRIMEKELLRNIKTSFHLKSELIYLNIVFRHIFTFFHFRLTQPPEVDFKDFCDF